MEKEAAAPADIHTSSHEEGMGNLGPLNLTLDNFDIPSCVPENCPYVLTSPRSLEACRILGIQPVELLPVSLRDYEKAFTSLDREQVLTVWREVESEREDQLELARRVRRQLAGDISEPRHCLSPIVEVAGRDSAVGSCSYIPGGSPCRGSSSNILKGSPSRGGSVNLTWSTETTSHLPGAERSDSGQQSSQEDSAIADCDEEERRRRRREEVSGSLARSRSVPTLLVTQSDRPEADQHLTHFSTAGEDDIESRCHGGYEETEGSSNHEGTDSELEKDDSHLEIPINWDQLSESSQESELMLLQDTPSPCLHGIYKQQEARFSSFSSFLVPEESEWDRVGRCYSEESESVQDAWESCEQRHTSALPTQRRQEVAGVAGKQRRPSITLQIPREGNAAAKPCVRTNAKKKAARKTRLNSESISSLYNGLTENETPESERGEKKLQQHQQQQQQQARPSRILTTVFSKSEINVSKLQLTHQECRLLEILAFKRYQEEYEERLKVQERRRWEKERRSRERTKMEIQREFRKRLLERRRQENEECQRRLIIARERFLTSQDHLRQLLKEKDERKKKLIQTIHQQKKALIRQWREKEESRRISVDRAVTILLERDTQYREQLNRILEKKLETVINRKISFDRINTNKIIERNKSVEELHQQRMEKMEELYDHHILTIKQGIEEKLRNAKQVMAEYRERQNIQIKKQSVYLKQSQVLALKAELENGLDLWRKQVLSVQSLSIRRAEERARAELDRRREKLAEEMRIREKRAEEKRKEQREESRTRMKLVRERIETKEKKVERLLSEREEAVLRARRMAETASRLRDFIRNQNLANLTAMDIKLADSNCRAHSAADKKAAKLLS